MKIKLVRNQFTQFYGFGQALPPLLIQLSAAEFFLHHPKESFPIKCFGDFSFCQQFKQTSEDRQNQVTSFESKPSGIQRLSPLVSNMGPPPWQIFFFFHRHKRSPHAMGFLFKHPWTVYGNCFSNFHIVCGFWTWSWAKNVFSPIPHHFQRSQSPLILSVVFGSAVPFPCWNTIRLSSRWLVYVPPPRKVNFFFHLHPDI